MKPVHVSAYTGPIIEEALRRAPGLTDEQIAIRKTGIGASEIAALVGLDHYKSAIDIWLSKTGRAEAFEMSEPAKWGLELEDVIARRYQREHGDWLVVDISKEPTRKHAEHPLVCATGDRLVRVNIGDRSLDRLLQIKTASFRMAHKWGEPGTDEIPENYFVQAQQEMAVYGIAVEDFAVLIGGNDYREYTVKADPELQAWLIEAAEKFWREHVETDIAPAVDGSASWANYLKRTHPKNLGKMLPATSSDAALVEQLKKAQEAIDAAEKEESRIKNELQKIIGDADGIEGADFRITWKLVNRKGYEVKPTSFRQFSAKFAKGER